MRGVCVVKRAGVWDNKFIKRHGGIKMELRDWLTILIPAGVTIIGLIVNYIATKTVLNERFQSRNHQLKLKNYLVA